MSSKAPVLPPVWLPTLAARWAALLKMEERMPPLLDEESFRLLLKGKEDFILCVSEREKVHPLSQEIFERYASHILVLSCTPLSCPHLYTDIMHVNPSILLFSDGKPIETIIVNTADDPKKIHKKIERFIKFVQTKEHLKLRAKIFQRSRKKLAEILMKSYAEIGGRDENNQCCDSRIG